MLPPKEASLAKPGRGEDGGASSASWYAPGTHAGWAPKAIFVPVFQEAGILNLASVEELLVPHQSLE